MSTSKVVFEPTTEPLAPASTRWQRFLALLGLAPLAALRDARADVLRMSNTALDLSDDVAMLERANAEFAQALERAQCERDDAYAVLGGRPSASTVEVARANARLREVSARAGVIVDA